MPRRIGDRRRALELRAYGPSYLTINPEISQHLKNQSGHISVQSGIPNLSPSIAG